MTVAASASADSRGNRLSTSSAPAPTCTAATARVTCCGSVTPSARARSARRPSSRSAETPLSMNASPSNGRARRRNMVPPRGDLLAHLCHHGPVTTAGEPDYRALLAFRTALRRFNHWSEAQAEAAGLTHAQHQLLLAVKGHHDGRGPTIGEVADYLLLRHHSAVELINRAQAAGFVERTKDPE